MARPHKLHDIIRRDERGQPVTVSDLFLNEITNGNPMDVAAALAGTGTKTIHNWLTAGARAEERALINPDKQQTKDDLDYRTFLHAYEAARAEAEAMHWRHMGQLAAGGTIKRVTRKYVILEGENEPVNAVEITETIENRLPSFNALRWILANGYGRRDALEVIVNNGALSEDERADELANVIEAWLAAQPELGTGNGHP